MLNNIKLRIFIVAGLLDSGDVPLIITKNLREMGHEVRFLPFDTGLPKLESYLHKTGRKASKLTLSLYSRRVYKSINSFSPDIFLIYGSNWGLLPEMIEKIKRDFGCRVALWEGNLQFWRWFQSEALRHYDYIFVNDSYVIPMLTGPAKLNNVFHLPFNMGDPDIHRPLDLTDEEKRHYGSDIAFIGMGHPERRNLFENLTEFDLKLWGKNWDRSDMLKAFFVNQPVSMEEKIRIYQCAKINVNIQSKTYQIDGISAKIFEIAASGGFFLTEKKKDLALFFKEEEDFISFRNIDELKEKIMYYLAHPVERKKLSEKMRDKVIINYTYKHKLNDMIGYLQD